MDEGLAGRVAVVTGAAKGIGHAVAEAFADAGAIVHAGVRNERDATAAEDRFGAEAIRMDVSDVDQVRAAVDALLSRETPDVLVNNAGVNLPRSALDVEPDDWDTIFDTNLRGAFFVTQRFARHWIRTGTPASVVMVGSQAGRVAIEGRSVYGTSKAGLEQLVRNLAYEWASAGIRVNAVAPTFVRTELTTDLDGAFADTIRSRIPLGRIGEPAEVADAVLYLAGPGASLVTGHTLVVDGGYTIH